eukprot:gi/632990290/ref/XP_007884100.1/ PREDICTED: uncharacterized protein LOC103173254 [Callorhinchus milii]
MKFFLDKDREQPEEKINVTRLMKVSEKNYSAESPVVFDMVSKISRLAQEKSVEKDYIKEPSNEASAALLPKGTIITSTLPGLHRNLSEDVIAIISSEEDSGRETPSASLGRKAGNSSSEKDTAAHPANPTSPGNGGMFNMSQGNGTRKESRVDLAASQLVSEINSYMLWIVSSNMSANASAAQTGQRFLDFITKLNKLISKAPKVLARNSTKDLEASQEILGKMVFLSVQQAKQLQNKLEGKEVHNLTNTKMPNATEAKLPTKVNITVVEKLKTSNHSNQLNETARMFYQLQKNLVQLKEQMDKTSKAKTAWLLEHSLTIASQLKQIQWLRKMSPLIDFELETLENFATILMSAGCLTQTSHWDECISITVEEV